MKPGATTRDLEGHLSLNPASPLFARLAEHFLRTGEISRAERLCERGLEIYPNYPTGLLIYARCLAARGRYADALRSIAGVASRYPGNIVLGGIEAEWGELSGPGTSAEADGAAVFTEMGTTVDSPAIDTTVEAEVATVEAEVATVEAEVATQADDVGKSAAKSHAVDTVDPGMEPATNRMIESVTAPATLAAPTLSDDRGSSSDPGDDQGDTPGDYPGVPAPMPIPSAGAEPVPLLQPIPPSWKRGGFIEGDRIVSRTLAEIYASQGAIGEAVATYRLLLSRAMPDQRESLEERLRELEDRLGNEPGERPPPVE